MPNFFGIWGLEFEFYSNRGVALRLRSGQAPLVSVLVWGARGREFEVFFGFWNLNFEIL